MRGIIAAVLLLVVALAPRLAAAHATLITTDPADGAVIKSEPAQIALTFNEPVKPLVMRLVNPVGDSTTLTNMQLEGDKLVVSGLPPLGEGTHALSYRVISADGHPVGGTIAFSIGRPTGGRPVVANETEPLLAGLILVLRFLIYLGLAVGVGGRFFAAVLSSASLPAVAMRATTTSLIVGIAAALVSVGLQGLDALGLPAVAFTNPSAWAAGAATTYGITVACAVVAMLLALLPGRTVAIAAVIMAGVALAASGHASAADPQWLTRPSVFLHVAGVVIWIGALIPLGAMLRAGGRSATDALMAFSRVIPFALGPLVIAGVILAVVQLQSVEALWTTRYGIVFCAKMALVALLLGIAACNRFLLTPGIAKGDGRASRHLRQSIVVECVLAALIFAVVSVWRFTPPPRALAAENVSPVLLHIHTEKAMSDITIAPGRAGRVSVIVLLENGEFEPLQAKGLTLDFANKAAGLEPFSREARRQDDGRWVVDNVTLPVGGHWDVTAEILIDDFTRVSLEGEVDVRP